MQQTPLIWTETNDKLFLKFVFKGYLSLEQAAPAIENWKKEFELKLSPGQRTNIIWDCLEITGFDPKVKKIWQDTLKELSAQIDNIWLISTNSIIRLAATTMGMFSRYSIKVVNSEAEIS